MIAILYIYVYFIRNNRKRDIQKLNNHIQNKIYHIHDINNNQRKNYNELLLSSLEEENDIFLPKISLNVFNNKYHYKLSHNEA